MSKYVEYIKYDFRLQNGVLMMKKWYVIFTRAGHEQNVRKLIEQSFSKEEIKLLVPKRKIIERKKGQRVEKIKLLFPGYVFIHTNMSDEVYYRIRNVLDFAVFLKDGFRPAHVKEDDMRVILSLTGYSDLIGFSKGINIGGRVKIIDGPLKGYEGLIESIDKRKGRAKVRLKVAGDLKVVDLGIYIVENIENKIRTLTNIS